MSLFKFYYNFIISVIDSFRQVIVVIIAQGHIDLTHLNLSTLALFKSSMTVPFINVSLAKAIAHLKKIYANTVGYNSLDYV